MALTQHFYGNSFTTPKDVCICLNKIDIKKFLQLLFDKLYVNRVNSMAICKNLFMLFSPCSLYSRCLFLHWNTPILIFLPSLFNLSPNVTYNTCPNKLFVQLYFFSMPLSVHGFFFSLFSTSITLVYKFIANDFYCLFFTP